MNTDLPVYGIVNVNREILHMQVDIYNDGLSHVTDEKVLIPPALVGKRLGLADSGALVEYPTDLTVFYMFDPVAGIWIPDPDAMAERAADEALATLNNTIQGTFEYGGNIYSVDGLSRLRISSLANRILSEKSLGIVPGSVTLYTVDIVPVVFLADDFLNFVIALDSWLSVQYANYHQAISIL